ncbi:hypothetical protein K7I15_00890 [Marinobacter shengliensis]|nr:hypothetical protein [Marinobacter shengliensis]
MPSCKTIGCRHSINMEFSNDYCPDCLKMNKLLDQAADPIYSQQEETRESSGGDNDYWLLHIPNPKRLEPYTVECEDIIEAMEMTFQEGEAFKALFRKCKIRMGDGKPGDSELRCSEKVAHFGQRMVVMDQRKVEKHTCSHSTH